MLIPAIFYSDLSSGQSINYTFDNKGGPLNVDNFVQGKAHWLDPSASNKQNKKTLVLADWTAYFKHAFSPEKKIAAARVLRELLKQGFKIYLWEHGKALSFDEQDITRFLNGEVLIGDPIPHQEIIAKTADQYNLSASKATQIHVLDDYWLQALIEQKFDQAREVDLDYFAKEMQAYKMQEFNKSLSSYFASLSPRLKKIAIRNLSADLPELYNFVKDTVLPKLPGVELVREYESLKITPEQIPELLNDKLEISSTSIQINFQDLDNIKKLSIVSSERSLSNELDGGDGVIDIFKKAKNIEIFSMVAVPLMNELPDDLNLDSIKFIELTGVTLSAKNLLTLCRAKNLKGLQLNFCTIDGNTEDLEGMNIPSLSLAELEIKGTNISGLNFIKAMMRNANTLHTIQGIEQLSVKGDLEEIDKWNLSSLNNLTINSDSISLGVLKKLSLQAKNLQILDIQNCVLSGVLNEDLHFPNLHELTLNAQEHDSTLLYHLLRKNTTIRSLSIKNYESSNFDLDNHPENLDLSSLETLSVEGEIDAKVLYCLIANSKNLKTLNFNACTIIGNFHQVLNLPQLKKLNLVSLSGQGRLGAYRVFSNIEGQALDCLIKSCSLEQLDVNGCVLSSPLPGCLNTKSLKLLKMDEMPYWLNKGDSNNDLKCFLENAENIDSLSLKNLSRFTSDMEHDLNLRSLKELSLEESQINLANLRHILIHTEKIKKMKIAASFIGGSIKEKINLDTLETLELNAVRLSSDILNHLLAQAKNLKKLIIECDCEINEINVLPPLLEEIKIYKQEILQSNLASLIRKGENLNSISIENSRIIDNLGVLYSKLPSVTSISLVNSSISMAFLSVLIFRCPNLQEINLTGCKDISHETELIDLENRDLKAVLKNRKINIKLNDDSKTPSSRLSSQPAQPSQSSQPSQVIQSNHLHPKQRRQNSQKFIDANTENVKRAYQLKQIFSGEESNPSPSEYRLSLHHKVVLNPDKVDVSQAFMLNNDDMDLTLQEVYIPQNKNDVFFKLQTYKKSINDSQIYYGKIDLILDKEWQALPSLSVNEKILEYHLSEKIDCEIKYSARDNLYYIRSKDNEHRQVSLDFLLEVYPLVPLAIPEKLQELLQYFKSFGIGSHDFKGPGTGQEYADAIIEAKCGACRHRAIVLMALIQQEKKHFGLSDTAACRYVENDCHAFVEIQLTPDSPWLAFDLGGYPAELKIDKSNLPKQVCEQPVKERQGFEVAAMLSPPEHGSAEFFQQYFETWHKEKPQQFNTPDAYCQQLASGLKSRQLIELPSTSDVEAMTIALEKYCHRIKRPVFYIHSPDDMVCSASFIKKQGDIGELIPGPGGPLYDFLTLNNDKSNPPVLIVNYDNFTANDIVRLNSFLDKQPKADGTALPDCAVVVGVINPDKPGCYKGSDFTSRFGKGNVETCPFADNELLPKMKVISEKRQMQEKLEVQEKQEEQEENFIINLCHAKDWKERLLGRWIIKKDKLHFEQGLLVQALASGRPIEIQNGLWSDPGFCHFWKRALALKRVTIQGESLDIAKAHFLRSQGYDWEKLKSLVSFDGKLASNKPVLNPSELNDYFRRYEVDNIRHELDTLPGWLEQHHLAVMMGKHQGATLDVNLTRSLSEDEWGGLLLACEKYQVQLHCHCTPSISLPAALADLPEISPLSGQAGVIKSPDVDVTVAQLALATPSYKIIDVSELSRNDLIATKQGEIKDGKTFYFTELECALTLALKNNEKVILKGYFSPELADALAPILLNNPENLILVTDDARHFNYTNVREAEVHPQDKYKILEACAQKRNIPVEKIKELNVESEPLCHLRAKLVSGAANPWQGMHGLSGGVRLNDFDVQNSQQKSHEFVRHRLDAVNTILEKSPFVFLAGLSGVGKSTFVSKYLPGEDTALYVSQANMQAWVEDLSNNKRKILFLDEANISAKQWSEFEGLFSEPPGILIKGKYYPLTENHKVVFAGNPLNYGGDRKMASLFERHGNALVFDPMPAEFIYEIILKPVFAGTRLETKSLEISQEILKVYKFLCECSNDDILISPRELQMMASLVVAEAYQAPYVNGIKAAQHHAYLIAKQVVPKKHLGEFETQFPDPWPTPAITQAPKDFVLTPSREPLYQYLNDLLALRQYRRETENLNEDQLYGGLGGIVLEGEPGIGKSELVTAQLLAHGFVEADLDTKNPGEKVFYRIPVSMQNDDKERLLLRAFHEGAIVIIDEVNSAPMMEALLNDLLMGKTPDGKRPNKPGCTMICTQNPGGMGGRYEASPALKRRLLHYELLPYPFDELMAILTQRGIQERQAKIMIDAYQMKRKQALWEKLSPAPNIRNVTTLADDIIKAKKDAAEKQQMREMEEIEKAMLGLPQHSLFSGKKETQEQEAGVRLKPR